MSNIIEADILQVGTGNPYNNTISSVNGTNTVFNQNKLNIDFEVKGTGAYSTLYYDASAGRLGVGTGLPDAVLHVIAPCAKDGLIVESISNCPTGVTLLLLHNPQTPPVSGSYPAIINLAGRDNNYNEIEYAQIKSRVLNPTTSLTSGEILFLVDHTGTNKEVFVASLSNLILGGNNAVSGQSYAVLGQNNISSGNSYLLVGSNNSGIQLNNSVAIGSDNKYSGPKVFVIANNSNINGSGSFVLGSNNNVTGINSTICGSNNTASGSYNLLLSNNNTLNSNYTIGIVQNASLSGSSGIVLGNNVVFSGNNNLSIGNNNTINGNNSSAVGSFLSSSGNRNIMFGNNISNSGSNLIFIGSDQMVSGVNNGIFIGNDLDLQNSQNVLYVGFNNNTQSGLNNSVVVGANNDLDNGVVSNLVMVGQYNLTNNLDNSVIIGNTNNASGNLRNNIILGSGNAVTNDSYNNILLGALNNQTGIYINSQGEVIGALSAVNTNNTNSIAIGVNNVSTLNNSNLLLGHKNIVSGTNLNILGSFNNARNTNRIYVLGNSNYVDGDNIVAVGRNIFGLGRDMIAVNNANANMSIYGSGAISIGNNRRIYSAVVVGQNNTTNGLSGLIYGNSNLLGLANNSFRYNTQTPNQISVNGEHLSRYQENDEILIQLNNPTNNNNLYVRKLSGPPMLDQESGTTTLTFEGQALTVSNRFFNINNTFDENNTPSTIVSGLVIPLKNYAIDKYYGSNNIVIGTSNTVLYSDSIVVGSNNSVSGTNSVVIGTNITGVQDDSVHIGSSNSNKIVLDNSQIVFNSGTAQQRIIVRNTVGDTALYHDLSSSSLGINNTAPRSSLDVSGTVTASSLRIGLSAISGMVLTSDTNGVASWQSQVSLLGSNNSGLLYMINGKVASGISNISYMPEKSGINFQNNLFVLTTGIFINDNRDSSSPPAVPLVMWGSGGFFAPKLMEISPSNNSASFFRTFTETGTLTGLVVNTRVDFPTSLTGTFLYVNNSGNLLSRTLESNNVLFSNNNSWSSGNNKFRWFDNNNIMTLSNTGIAGNTDPINGDSRFNIMLSSNPGIDTVFNRQLLGNNFSVYNSGEQGGYNFGFHILPASGQVGINITPASIRDEQSTLLVNGRLSANQFKYTSSTLNTPPASGLYLKVVDDGIIQASTLDISASFVGSYPIRVSGDNLTNSYTVDLSPLRADNSVPPVTDYGRTLALSADGWIVSSGLRLLSNKTTGAKGVLVGYNASLAMDNSTDGSSSQFNGIAYAGGSFQNSIEQLGDTQFSQFFLRGRLFNGGERTLTMNWDTLNTATQNKTAVNSIRLRTDKDSSWTYTIYVNGLMQQTGASTNKAAVGYIIHGTLFSSQPSTLSNVGQTIIAHTGSALAATRVIVEPVSVSDLQTLDIKVSGAPGYNYLWSATAMINQLQWPSSNTYSSTSVGTIIS